MTLKVFKENFHRFSINFQAPLNHLSANIAVRCWLLCPWPRLFVYSGHGWRWWWGVRGWRGIIWIPQSGLCGEGYSRPLLPPPKLTQTASQSRRDGLKPGSWHSRPTACWPTVWLGGREWAVDTAGGDRGAKKSSDLTGVKAPLSTTHTHTHVCAHTHNSVAQIRTISLFFTGTTLNVSPGKKRKNYVHHFGFAQECLWNTHVHGPFRLRLVDHTSLSTWAHY